jgi:hypothetical protein
LPKQPFELEAMMSSVEITRDEFKAPKDFELVDW